MDVRPFLVAALASAIPLTGCSSASEPEGNGTDSVPSEAAPTTSGSKVFPKKIAKVQPGAAWHSQIESVTETEPGRLSIKTLIVDPRGADGSPEAVTARRSSGLR